MIYQLSVRHIRSAIFKFEILRTDSNRINLPSSHLFYHEKDNYYLFMYNTKLKNNKQYIYVTDHCFNPLWSEIKRESDKIHYLVFERFENWCSDRWPPCINTLRKSLKLFENIIKSPFMLLKILLVLVPNLNLGTGKGFQMENVLQRLCVRINRLSRC